MKKRLITALILLVSLLTLAGCDTATQTAVSRDLGLDIASGKEISNIDTYSHGEGHSCIAVSFDDDSILNDIKGNAEWKAFPLDTTTQTLVYGIKDEAGETGPFLSDSKGNALVPEIQNGYYLLIDRHDDTKTAILERASFNFTVGLYDTDKNTLYYCKLDT